MKHMRVLPLLLLAAVLAGSCGPGEPYDRDRVERLRSRTEALIRAQSLMEYNSWVYGTPSARDSLYRTAADLFTKETLSFLRDAAAAEQDSLQRRRLWILRRFLTTEYVAMRAAALTDSVSNIEAAATVVVDGEMVPYRRLGALLANEPAQARREVLYTAADSVLGVLAPLHRAVFERYRRDAADLGFSSYTDMAEQLKEFSLRDLAVQAESLLSSTEAEYGRLRDEMVVRRLGIPVDRFRRYDAARLLRASEFDRAFPREPMLQVTASTWRGMGIDPDTLRTLRIDAEDRSAKNPRAACFVVDVPNDVRLSIRPVGGFQDYTALFHEMGHALHYAFTRENAVEFKYMGEYTVTETYAFLSEYLLVNQAWLRMKSGMPTGLLKDFVRAQAFVRLYMVRRYAAKVLYELELHGGTQAPESLYVSLQARAIGTQPHPSDRLRSFADVDAMFYAATYFRAWLLEAQLSRHLVRTYGMNWFENGRAGDFLRGLWAQGDRLTAPDLAAAAGEESITADALLEQVRLLVILSSKPTTARR